MIKVFQFKKHYNEYNALIQEAVKEGFMIQQQIHVTLDGKKRSQPLLSLQTLLPHQEATEHNGGCHGSPVRESTVRFQLCHLLTIYVTSNNKTDFV